MFNVFHLIGDFIDFFNKRTRASATIFVIFCFYALFRFLKLWEKEDFKTAVRRPLRVFRITFIVYFVYFLLLILNKEFILTPIKIDILLFPLLCGLLVFLILLIFNKAQIHVPNKFIILLDIPICILGAMTSLLFLYVVPLRFTPQWRHAPLELIGFILLALLFSSLFIGIKNFIERIKEKK